MKNESVGIVTGASQGIGRAKAERLARDYAAVVLAARHGDELEKTALAKANDRALDDDLNRSRLAQIERDDE